MNTPEQDERFQSAEKKADLPPLLQPPVIEPPPLKPQSDLPQPQRSLLGKISHGIYSVVEWCFGIFSLPAALAAISVIPVVNLLSLGYLLHVSGTIARTGRLRDGFIGVRRAGRLGMIIVSVWLALWPARLLAALRDSAVIVDPHRIGGWSIALWILTALTCLLIIFGIWLALGAPRKFARARDAIWETAAGLHLPFLFWLGARGFAGTLLWLLIPVGLMILASNIASNAGVLVSLLGSLLMMGVLLLLPFQQAWFARENRFRAFIEVGAVCRLAGRAPFKFWLALSLTLVLAVPLFLLKVELTPAEITWLPALFFVVFGLPARMMVGWAMGRADRREASRYFVLRWLCRLVALGLALPVVFSYVVILFFSQFISWNGTLSLLEQHAFLVPSPF